MQFAYEALNAEGRRIRALLEAGDRTEAVELLRSKGLLIMRLDKSSAVPQRAPGLPRGGGGPGGRDMVLFTRQMKMLLESGTPLVTALGAVEAQTAAPGLRGVLGEVRARVEAGDTLTNALAEYPRYFSRVFLSMISAGEASASLPEAFARLCNLAQRQQQVRRSVIGALVYPAVLSVMLAAVLGVLIGFVVPRFGDLFTSLNRELPWMTQWLLWVAVAVRANWVLLLVALVALLIAAGVAVRHPAAGAAARQAVLMTPMVGRLVVRLEIANMFRIWSALLRSRVPLLETLAESHRACGSAVVRGLVERVQEAVSSGSRVGIALSGSKLVDPVLAAAIQTGEENGRLSEAIEFVADWMEDDNLQAVSALTRTVEPVMLAGMGLIVGLVAMALFIPLFDIATAAGG